jgi:hypothetical protein
MTSSAACRWASKLESNASKCAARGFLVGIAMLTVNSYPQAAYIHWCAWSVILMPGFELGFGLVTTRLGDGFGTPSFDAERPQVLSAGAPVVQPTQDKI